MQEIQRLGLSKKARRGIKRALQVILQYMDERDAINTAMDEQRDRIEGLAKGQIRRDDLARIIKLARSSQDDVGRHTEAVAELADIWFNEEPAGDEAEDEAA